MLQQTQVERVIPYYTRWLVHFPTITSLADAPLKDVLLLWQGLGYNRRAKMLHEAAKTVVKTHGGTMPRTLEALLALPGVGNYTARAVLAFACNTDCVFVETNIRTVVTHHFYTNDEVVSDAEILRILEEALPKGESRAWYSALMDYGAHLKRAGVRINNRSKHYTKQSAFQGSDREVRGMILRALTSDTKTLAVLVREIGATRRIQIQTQLQALQKEGLITARGRSYGLPE